MTDIIVETYLWELLLQAVREQGEAPQAFGHPGLWTPPGVWAPRTLDTPGFLPPQVFRHRGFWTMRGAVLWPRHSFTSVSPQFHFSFTYSFTYSFTCNLTAFFAHCKKRKELCIFNYFLFLLQMHKILENYR